MSTPASHRTGLNAGLTCYTLWGLLPLLFHAVEAAGGGAFETVAWRTLWSIPCAGALVLIARQGPALRGLGLRTLRALTLSAALIAVNWTTYVWAVDHGRTLEGSLGYYINPLFNMAAGRVLFGERIDRSGWIAMALAGVGVALQTAALGAFPWVSIVLAVSFCGYAVVRKRHPAPPQAGLLVECLVLAIPAAAYLAWLGFHGGAAFGRDLPVTTLLIACGPATVVPLALFAVAASRLPLTLIGFLQFITPTIQFAVGIAQGEALTPLRALSFVFIWAGVAVFAAAAWTRGRARRQAVREAVEPV